MNDTHIIVVLDKSGSMTNIRSEVTKGFNEYVKDQQKLGEGARLTLAQFSSGGYRIAATDGGWYTKTWENVPIAEVEKLDDKNFRLSGGTALLDAIGKTAHEFEMKEQPEKVIFVIITDGEENSSTMYHLDHIHTIIRRKQKEGWECVFIGADQDAIQSGGGMGIRAGNTRSFDTRTKGSTLNMFKDVSTGTSKIRKAKSGEKVKFFADTEC